MTKNKTVIISDLHVDSWDPLKKVAGGKTKGELFFDFLDWIEPFTSRLVINGDLLDAPPKPKGDILPTYEKFILRLIALSEKMELYYFIGNHDIGMWGLKVKGFHNINILYPYYPNLYLHFGPEEDPSYVYLEHGHFYDPVLNLYLYNVVKALRPRGGLFREIGRKISGFFKRTFLKKTPPPRPTDVGTLNKAVMRASQRRDPSTGKKVQPSGTYNWRNHWNNLETFIWKQLDPLVNQFYKPFNWEDAANDVFKDFSREHPEKKIKSIIFGHTHFPQEETISYKDKEALYLNSGDWNEPIHEKDPDTHHASFIVLDEHGSPVRGANGKAVRDFITENYP